jgi:hypothetical protein
MIVNTKLKGNMKIEGFADLLNPGFKGQDFLRRSG